MERRLILTPPRMLWDTTVDVLQRWHSPGSFEPALVIAPTRTTARRLIAAAAEGRGAVAGLTPGTWHDLARSCAAFARDALFLPPGVDALVVGQIVEHTPGPWGELAAQPGFHRALAGTVRDLADAGVSRLQSPPAPAEIAEIFNSFQSHLDAYNLVDDARLYRAAAEGTRHGLPFSRIVVHAIYDLTGVQAALVEAIATSSTTDIVWIAPDPEMNGAQFARPLVQWLEGELSLTTTRSRSSSADGLDGLSARLDGTAVSDGPVDADLTVLACAGPHGETNEIIRSVLAAAADGVPWREMMVISPTPESLPELARRLERCSVPTAGGTESSLADHPSGRAIATLFDIVDGHTDRRTVIRFLTSAPIRAERLGSRAQPSCWSVLTRLAGCTGGDTTAWRRSLDARRAELERRARVAGSSGASEQTSAQRSPDALNTEARQLRLLAGIVADLLENTERCARRIEAGSWSDAAAAMIRLIDSWLEPTETVEAVRGAINTLASCDRIGVHPRPGAIRRQIVEVLERSAAPTDESASGAGHRPGAAVLLCSWQGARGARSRAAWLVGLGSGTFPPPVRQDPILPDLLRRRIADATGCPVPLKLRRADEAELQLRLGIASARERLTLSYVRSDPLTGRAQLPSHGVVECTQHAEGRHLGYEQLHQSRFVRTVPDQPPTGPSDPGRPVVHLAEYDLVAALNDPTGDGAHLVLDHRWLRQLRCDRSRYASTLLTAWDGLVDPTHRTGPMWVTTLEELATCPFRYFLRTVLALTPAPDPSEELQPDRRQVGTLAHTVVETLLKRWQAAKGSLPQQLDPVLITEVVDEVNALARLHADTLGSGARALWTAATEELARHLALTIDRELRTIASNCWRPKDSEVAHEGTVKLADVSLRLRGRADRVDETVDNGLVVTDYKYSKGGNGSVKLCGGRRLQLPFYAHLMASRFDAPFQIARYAYLRADAEKPERTLSVDELREMETALADLTRELITVVRSGTLFQFPEADRERCRGCDFNELCGPSVRAVFRRKRDTDPRLQRHADLDSEFP